MKEIIELKSMSIGDSERTDYDEPIKMQKVKFADGVFLCDPIMGMMCGPNAKQIKPGIYESCCLSGHLMFEDPA